MSLKLRVKRFRSKFTQASQKLLLLEGRRASMDIAKLPPSTPLEKAGFGVFSQHDEDGIIQFLLNHVEIKNRTFVEFGVENYQESNTRFLLMNDNWQGLVIDASPENIDYIAQDEVSRKWDLQMRCSFITRANINQLLRETGFPEDLGLLSIDIDGNDYWIWQAIETCRPRIVVVEYNSVFGRAPVSIPYQENFFRGRAHPSYLYYGCSLAALGYLANKKGYAPIGSNQRGNNAFFVRRELIGKLPERSPEEAYVLSRFKSRDGVGQFSRLRGEQRREAIAHLPVVDVVTGETTELGREKSELRAA